MKDLPYGWRRLPLADACSLITDGSHYSPATVPEGMPYVTVRDVVGGVVDIAGSARIAVRDFRQLEANGCRPQRDDVLFSKDGTVGRVARVRDDRPFVVLSSLAILRPAQDVVLPQYLESVLTSPGAQDQARLSRTGTALRRVVLRNLRQLRIPVPPLDEQQRIVDILQDHLSRLGAADDYARRAPRLTESLRTSVYRTTFRGLAETYGVEPLITHAGIDNGQTPKGLGERLSNSPSPGAIPFFKIGDMNESDGRWMRRARFYVSAADAAALGLHVRAGGTVLIPKRGGAIATNKKRILAAPATYDLNTMGLRPSASLSSEYLWHWLSSVDLGQIADGSNVPQINAPQIRRLSLPVPPPSIQAGVVADLDSSAAGLTRLEAAGTSVRQRSASLRRALLMAAFSGRLTGRSSDLDLAHEMAAT